MDDAGWFQRHAFALVILLVVMTVAADTGLVIALLVRLAA